MACFTMSAIAACNDGADAPQLTGTKAGCFFGEIGHTFFVLIKVLWPVWTDSFILGCLSRICLVDRILFMLYSVRVGSRQALPK